MKLWITSVAILFFCHLYFVLYAYGNTSYSIEHVDTFVYVPVEQGRDFLDWRFLEIEGMCSYKLK